MVAKSRDRPEGLRYEGPLQQGQEGRGNELGSPKQRWARLLQALCPPRPPGSTHSARRVLAQGL